MYSVVIAMVLAIAVAEIGYYEKASNSGLDDKSANAGTANYTKYARDIDKLGVTWGNKNGFAWCATWCLWVFYKAFGIEKALAVLCSPKPTCIPVCSYGVSYFKSAGRWHTSDPQPGDIIFFTSGGIVSHQGIVEKVDGDKVTTIEGNTMEMVAKRVYNIGDHYILGYGRPRWELVAPSGSGDVTRWLSMGCTGEDVRKLQEDLIALGYELPRYGADGDFGRETYDAVCQFQSDNNLEVDGVVGDDTISAIELLMQGVANVGDSNEEDPVRQIISDAGVDDEYRLYCALRQKGLSAKAAAVVLGHGYVESGNECNRVQGDFSQDRSLSISYTQNVDNGRITKNDFVYHGPNGGGYGWLQWTYSPRKEGLWNKAKSLGVSIGSVKAAIEWFWDEMNQGEYRVVLNALQSDMGITDISNVFMHKFERPADQSDAACAKRAAICQKMYDKYANIIQDDPIQPSNRVQIYWPPRMLCAGMTGGDVDALQGLLVAHGYDVGNERGVFDEQTDNAVRKYQEDNGLDADGVAGPLTFASLMKT